MDTSTIAAIATPIGNGGIGIIKISGKNAFPIAGTIFMPSCKSGDVFDPLGKDPPQAFESHRIYYGYVVDPAHQSILDEVLLVAMRAPRSYTREDVVEIHTHSGVAVLHVILDLVLKNGADLAAPGDFTRRAFLNGRIDLTQAEAVVDIIQAKTKESLEIAVAQVRGGLKWEIEKVRDCLFRLRRDVEAEIDFPEESMQELNASRILDVLQNGVRDPLKKLVKLHEEAHVFRDGLRLIIVGRPNVGKSSLMNRMLQKDRMIVTSTPGTTRDIVEDGCIIHGIPVVLMDSAGLHDTDDPIESIGMEKTQEYIECSDMVLFVVDADRMMSDADTEIFQKIKEKPLIIVINKIDLVDASSPLCCPEDWYAYDMIHVSALYDQGIPELKNLIARHAGGKTGLTSHGQAIPNLRHKIALERSLQAIEEAIQGIQSDISLELVAIDVKEAMDVLGEIMGETTTEDLLEEIFSRFCVGK